MTATRVRTARMTPSKVKKLRSLWARRASSASLKVSESATRLLRHPPLAAMPARTLFDAGFPELLSNGVTPKACLRDTADTIQYENRSPFVSRKCEGYVTLDAAERICFARRVFSAYRLRQSVNLVRRPLRALHSVY